MTKPVNIFGLTREEVTISGLPLLKRQSLTPAERIWLQENSEAARNEWNVAYLAFVDAVKDKLKYKTQEDAYHAVKEYFRGTLDTVESDKIELLSLEKPLKRDRDIDQQELTYLLNSRLIAAKFPIAEFSEVFGIEYAGEWTIEHTKAIAELHDELTEFFASESEGKKKPEVGTGK
jgi:phage-related tail protein